MHATTRFHQIGQQRGGRVAARGRRVILDLHQVSLTRLGSPGHLPGRQLMSTKFSPAAVKPQVSLEDLNKLDIRVGTIELVEEVQHSDKLVRLRVDFGDHMRTILVGMKKERPNPKAEIEGRQALFVINLPIRTMAGEKSEGMIFDIGFSDGILPRLAVPETAVPNGARAG